MGEEKLERADLDNSLEQFATKVKRNTAVA